jgi:HSP20 family protein
MLWNFGNFDDRLMNDFRRIQREMDGLFGHGPARTGIRATARGSYPPVNVGATEDQVEIYVFAAGVEPKDLDISIQQNLLSIAGERKLDGESEAEHYRRERFQGKFHRVITLPDDVDPERVSAQYRDGVLHINVKRRESSRPRQIEVH